MSARKREYTWKRDQFTVEESFRKQLVEVIVGKKDSGKDWGTE